MSCAALLILALLAVGQARAQNPASPNAVAAAADLKPDPAAIGMASAARSTCPGGSRIPWSKKEYAASVCIGEFQKYAKAKACDAFPQYISDSGLSFYGMDQAFKPTCWDGKGKYWCLIKKVRNPCLERMPETTGSMSVQTKPRATCKKSFPSPGPTPKIRLDPGTLRCPSGYKKAGTSVVQTYLQRWLEDERRSEGVLDEAGQPYCSLIGFDWIDVAYPTGCIRTDNKALISQGKLRWQCMKAGAKEVHSLSIRITDGKITLVCPWDTRIELDWDKK